MLIEFKAGQACPSMVWFTRISVSFYLISLVHTLINKKVILFGHITERHSRNRQTHNYPHTYLVIVLIIISYVKDEKSEIKIIKQCVRSTWLYVNSASVQCFQDWEVNRNFWFISQTYRTTHYSNETWKTWTECKQWISWEQVGHKVRIKRSGSCLKI